MNQALPSRDSNGLYNPDLEHDACGVGLVARISGERSNAILETALLSICSLMHRGALDADAKTGDGAGITTQIPYKIFTPEVEKLGHTLYNPSDLGVGVMFLPAHNEYETARARAITEEVLKKRELFVFGWRVVPINDHVLGEKAQSTMPLIEQVLVGRPAGMSDDDYERRLFLARNEIEDRAAADKIKDFYIPSFSHRTIVHKGLLVSASLEKFYPDLANPEYETAIALFHQRYSTNTFPTWPLAHPFRMLAHNGEINTIRGNRNWMHAREAELKADFWGADIDLLKPTRRLRLREPRQCARGSHHERSQHPARRDDARAPVLPHRPEHLPGDQRFLQLPPLLLRAVGWPCRSYFHRWRHCWSMPRPQRTPACTLQHH
jgi:glutamate synthase (NADPH/NADH) large chain/glutamate synthase (ferredoxin)